MCTGLGAPRGLEACLIGCKAGFESRREDLEEEGRALVLCLDDGTLTVHTVNDRTVPISNLGCVPKPPQTCPTGYSGTNCEIADDCLATDVQDTTLPNEIYCDNLFASGKTGACECVQGVDALADALALALGSSGASLFSPSLFSQSLFSPFPCLLVLLL